MRFRYVSLAFVLTTGCIFQRPSDIPMVVEMKPTPYQWNLATPSPVPSLTPIPVPAKTASPQPTNKPTPVPTPIPTPMPTPLALNPVGLNGRLVRVERFENVKMADPYGYYVAGLAATDKDEVFVQLGSVDWRYMQTFGLMPKCNAESDSCTTEAFWAFKWNGSRFTPELTWYGAWSGEYYTNTPGLYRRGGYWRESWEGFVSRISYQYNAKEGAGTFGWNYPNRIIRAFARGTVKEYIVPYGTMLEEDDDMWECISVGTKKLVYVEQSLKFIAIYDLENAEWEEKIMLPTDAWRVYEDDPRRHCRYVAFEEGRKRIWFTMGWRGYDLYYYQMD